VKTTQYIYVKKEELQ